MATKLAHTVKAVVVVDTRKGEERALCVFREWVDVCEHSLLLE